MEHIKEIIARGRANLGQGPNLNNSVTPGSGEITPRLPVEGVCPDCGGSGFFRYDVEPGHPNFGKLSPCENPIHRRERADRLAKISGMTATDTTRRLSDIEILPGNREAIRAANKVITAPQDNGFLYLWGGPGNAKTELLKAIINELDERGHGPVFYAKFTKIIDWLRDAYAEMKKRDRDGLGSVEGNYIARFDRLKGFRVLAIDEMDKARITPFVNEFQFDFLDDRYNQAIAGETVTIFAGNENPDTLPSPIYDRLRDGRFRDSGIVEITALSARPDMRR